MLKIEVIKFEAQDIITNSGLGVEDIPVAPNNRGCLCGNGCDQTENGHQIGYDGETETDIYCPAQFHDKCPKYE